MTPEERRATLLSETEDVAREDQIFLREGVEMAMAQPKFSLQEVNTRFNEELATLTEENAIEKILNVSTPSSILLACGIENKPIRLHGAKLLSKVRKHGYDLDDLKNLPLAMSEPIAVFNGSKPNSFAILTELRVGDNNILAALSVGKGGHDVDFNIISSVCDKRGDSVARWVNDGKMLWVDKKKALDYFSVSAPLAEAQNNQEPISTTNIIQNFQNPKIEARNSLVTPEMDASYLDAVERGDMATAQKMVLEAAKLAMPNTKVVDEDGEPKAVYHGDRKKARYIFSTDTFFTPDAKYAKRYTNSTGEVYATYLDIKKPFDIRDKKAYDIFTEFRGGRKPVATTTGAMDWAEYSYEDLQEYVEDVAPNEYDGFILDEGADPDGNGGVIHRGLSYVPFNPNQIKSADPVTYDDSDNVIPLSERFNPEKEDIRCSLAAYNGDIERILSDSKAIAKAYAISSDVIVAKSAQDYITALLAYGVPENKIYSDTDAVYLDWEDVIVVNAQGINTPIRLTEVLTHENMHSISHQDKEGIAKVAGTLPILKVVEYAGNELGYSLDYIKKHFADIPLEVVDEILSTFVESISTMPVVGGGYVLRRYLMGYLTIEDALEASKQIIKEKYGRKYSELTAATMPLLQDNLIKLRDERYKEGKVGNTTVWSEGSVTNGGGFTETGRSEEESRAESQTAQRNGRAEAGSTGDEDGGVDRLSINTEMDAAYLDAVERGDMATAQRMVMEAAKMAMPNTKVVDEDGNPKVVYHGDRKKTRCEFSADIFFTPHSNYERLYIMA